MVTRRFPRALGLAAILLAMGCGPSPRAHLPGQLRWQAHSDLGLSSPVFFAAGPTNREALVCSLNPQTPSAVCQTTPDLGQTWSASRTGPSGLPTGVGLESSARLVQTRDRAILVAETDGGLASAFSEDQGMTWKSGGSTPVEGPARISYLGAGSLGAGQQLLAVVGPSETLKYPLHISVDQGDTWKSLPFTTPSPPDQKNVTVIPPHWSDGPRLLVDSKDRIHFLYPDFRWTSSDGNKQQGSLYCRSLEGQNPDIVHFQPSDYHRQEAALGRNHSLPDALYRVTLCQDVSKETSNLTIPNRVQVSVSPDAGKSWSKPLVLDNHAGVKQFPRVEGDGKLVVISWRDDRSSNPGLYLCSSLDGGIGWSAAERVGDSPGNRHYQLTVRQKAVLLVGTREGPSSFQPGPTFAIRGQAP